MDKGDDTVAWYRSLGEIIDGLESEQVLEHFIERFGRLVAFDLASD